jgi:hypothetical protein
MILDIWAEKWGIPDSAINELKMMMGAYSYQEPRLEFPLSESAVLNLVRLEASQAGCRLWRNNVGATYTENGSFIRYGLANDSAKLNAVIKSADLIGIRPVKITAEMVGRTIGQFMSREIKSSDWKYTGTDRERAQLEWGMLVLSLGGNACFATNTGTI